MRGGNKIRRKPRRIEVADDFASRLLKHKFSLGPAAGLGGRDPLNSTERLFRCSQRQGPWPLTDLSFLLWEPDENRVKLNESR